MSGRKIAVLTSHSAAGGAGEIMANIGEGLQARGHEVTLHALYPHANSTLKTAGGWRYVLPARPGSPWAAAKLLPAMIAWLKRDRPDVIVSALPAANVMAAIGARLAGTGTHVITTHHTPLETQSAMLGRIDGQTGALSSVRHIVSVSNSVSRSLDGMSAAYRAKRRTITNALPPEIEALLERLSARHRERTPGRKVVAIGRLADQKNYPVLIRAATRMPDVSLAIVGRGDQEAELRALVEQLGVGDRVTFLGHQLREDALALLADGDVFVQMSLFEGHSLALVEAAKLGLPLIVSDVPVQVEGVTTADGTQCGVIVPLHDDERLAQEITAMLDDPERRQRYEALAVKLASEARFDRMVDAYDALIADGLRG